MAFPLPLDTAPMEAALVSALPVEDGWQFEPKWDGFRCLAYKSGAEVDLRAKSGKTLARYFPEVQAALLRAEADEFVLDGELVVPTGGALSFGALQDRIHPADSRIRRLAAETPALLILFDCLAAPHHGVLIARPLTERRAALEQVATRIGRHNLARLTPCTRDKQVAERWLAGPRTAMDGVVAKRLHGPYNAGRRDMLKCKRIRSAECVVGGFRYARGSRGVGSLLLGLFNDAGRLDHVGFCSAISNAERPSLTLRLEALRGGEGFSGEAPGGPSRWSTDTSAQWERLRPELVVEVSYDQVTDGRFRHGTGLVRWRPDKAPGQCTRAQLAEPAHPHDIIEQLSC